MNNIIIFYILLALLFYVFSKAGMFISNYLKMDIDVTLVLLGILFTGVIYLLKGMSDIKDNFHFELTPEKKCDGGPYMYTSDPEKQKLCSQFTKQQLSEYSCPPGFHGRPVWWERSDESNADWANTMCDNGFNDDYPKVL